MCSIFVFLCFRRTTTASYDKEYYRVVGETPFPTGIKVTAQIAVLTELGMKIGNAFDETKNRVKRT